jgi:hypothetical protein
MGPSAFHGSGHFYFAQTGHSHFAATEALKAARRPDGYGRMRERAALP